MTEPKKENSGPKRPFATLLVISCGLILLGYGVFYLNEEPTAEKALRDGTRGALAEEYIRDRNYARIWGCGIILTGLSGIIGAFLFLKNKTGVFPGQE